MGNDTSHEMKVLERARNWPLIIGGSFTPMPFVLYAVSEFPLPLMFSFFLLALTYSVSLIFWVKNGSKPAAWISGDILHIRTGVFSEITIDKSKVESISYRPNKTAAGAPRPNGVPNTIPCHIISVKLSDHQPWEIVIKDPIEHMAGMRLYHFIRKNFLPIKLIK